MARLKSNIAAVVAIAAAATMVGGIHTGEAAPKRGGTLVVIDTANPRHFNSAVQSGVATMWPAAQIFAAPLRYDSQWNPHPYLADKWEVADDGLSVTLHLNKNATFHDGKPVTSADVAFSIEANRDNHPFKPMFGPVTKIDTPDPYTAIIRLSQPHPAILLALSAPLAPIIPKHIYGDGQNLKKHPRNTKDVIGSGPFKLTEFKRREHFILTRNENFFMKGRPYLDKIIGKNSGQTASQIIAMERGQVDMTGYVTSSRVLSRLSKSKDLTITKDGYAALGPTNYLAFNLLRKPVSDVRVRHAIAYAIDREFITKVLHAGFSTPLTGPIVPTSPFYEGNVEKYDVDLAKANKILDDAGYKKGKDGYRFQLTADYLPSARIEEQQKTIAEYLRPQLKKIGIKIKVRTAADFPTWAKTISNHNYDMTMDVPFNWGDPVIGVHRTWLTSNIKKGVIWSNTHSYSNPTIDALLNKAGRELDVAKRKATYSEFQKKLVDDLPVYWINVMSYHTVYNHTTVGNPPLSIFGMMSPMLDVYKKN